MIAVAYGGGTDSTAMCIELVERGERFDVATFADTGAERPETYRYVAMFSEWLQERGYPAIQTVQSQNKDGAPYTLEGRCLENKMLPSIAYGFKACSEKHKTRPQERHIREMPEAQAIWAVGGKITKLIGYELGEERRATIPEDSRYVYRYPLIEWEMDREACVETIRSVGLPLPGKSACFFCPSSRPHEIIALHRQHPDLLRRALAMEANADLNVIKGLGRNWSWSDLIRSYEAQIDMFDGAPDLSAFRAPTEIPCGCYDGGAEEGEN